MLFAAIDSFDGTGVFPAGDFLAITLDATLVFRESFANAPSQQIQSYVPAPSGELARHADLDFTRPGGYYTLRANPIPCFQPHPPATARVNARIGSMPAN